MKKNTNTENSNSTKKGPISILFGIFFLVMAAICIYHGINDLISFISGHSKRDLYDVLLYIAIIVIFGSIGIYLINVKKPIKIKKTLEPKKSRSLLDEIPTEATIHVQQSDITSNNYANKYISSVENKIKFTGNPLSKTAYNQIDSLLANQSEEYNNEILPNGSTIAEQQTIGFNIALERYPKGTSEYLNMKIVPNTVPANEGYNTLNEHEKIFFQAFSKQLIEAKLNPSFVQLRRLSSGCFNVNYSSYYIGKINLYELPTSYAVIKKGNKRATKIFDNLLEAEEYVSHKENYEIEIRKTPTRHYMQYLKGISTMKEIENPSLEQCIECIPYIIRYIKYCKKT